MTESQDPSPEPPQGKVPIGEGEWSAESQVGAADQPGDAKISVSDDNQQPASQMEGGPDEGGDSEIGDDAPRFWAELKKDPFAVVLSIATCILAIATVVLAVSTIALWSATRDLGTYAQQQDTDLQTSLGIANKSVTAAQNLVEEIWKAGETAYASLGVAKEGLEIQRVNTREALKGQRAHVAVVEITVTDFHKPGLPLIDPPSPPPEGHLQIRNTGSTRGLNLAGWAHMVIAPASTKQFRTNGPDLKFSSATIESTLDGDVTIEPDNSFSPDDMAKVFSGKAVIFVYGRFHYADVLREETYTTRFRYESVTGNVPSDGVLRLIQAPDGNEAE